MLSLEDLRFRYPDGREALRGLTFTVREGERVALVGPNGAGKSTLLLHLVGLLRGEGTLRVGDTVVADETLAEVRRRVGLLFQDPDDQLFCPSVEEDVAFGPLCQGLSAEEVEERIRASLAQVGMAEHRERSPQHLSQGEKKRVALASVLSCAPEILVLDEPSAGLDPRARRSLIGLLATLPQTMLLATHDLPLAAELCSRLLVLDEGRLVADGATGDLMADEALLERHGLEWPVRGALPHPPDGRSSDS